MSSTEWRRIDDAAAHIGRHRSRVYDYIAKNPSIRTMRVAGTTFVNLPDLLAHEATVKPGRPRRI